MYTVAIEPCDEEVYIFADKAEVLEFVIYESLREPDIEIETFNDFLDFWDQCISVEYRPWYMNRDT